MSRRDLQKKNCALNAFPPASFSSSQRVAEALSLTVRGLDQLTGLMAGATPAARAAMCAVAVAAEKRGRSNIVDQSGHRHIVTSFFILIYS